MARSNFTGGQEIAYADFNKLSAAIERGLYDRVLYELIGRNTDAFFDDSMQVEYATANSVTVRPGCGFQNDATQANPEPTKRLVYKAASSSHSISSPHASLNRIDIVSVKANRANSMTEARNVKDAITNVVASQSVAVQTDWQADVIITSGTAAASPVAPATPAGYIKIAELTVTAVSGLSGAGAVTDVRSRLPLGSLATVNTLGFTRLTASAGETVASLMAELDALCKNPNAEYIDIEDLEADPAAPLTADYQRLFVKGDVAYLRNTAGTITPLGSGGGGGGGATWNSPAGSAPIVDEENGEKVYLFEQGSSNKLVMFVKVPQGYLSGRPISMYIGQYSPSAANTQLLKSTAYLVRKNLDAISSTTNSRVSTNAAITNTVADQYREVSLDLTASTGTINSVGVTAGDLIRVELTRGTDTDTAEVRFVPSSTEVKFG